MLQPMTFILLDGETPHELAATAEAGRIRLSAQDVRDVLGWELKAEGLCRGEICIPVRDRASLVEDGKLDLEALAALLDRPLALDADEGVAALGESASSRAAVLDSLDAPDFSLPDLSGRLHSLSEQRGKKVLLIAYASW
jgi:hypothetical protein